MESKPEAELEVAAAAVGAGNAHFVVAALLMEFAVGVHSVIIGEAVLLCVLSMLFSRESSNHLPNPLLNYNTGLTLAILSDSGLSALLVALCFHQVTLV